MSLVGFERCSLSASGLCLGLEGGFDPGAGEGNFGYLESLSMEFPGSFNRW